MEQKALTIEDLEGSPIKKLEISSESESDGEIIIQFTAQKAWTENSGVRESEEEKENVDNRKQLSLSDLQPSKEKTVDEQQEKEELKIGKRVKTKTGKEGVIRFIGETKAAAGVWVGIELDGPGIILSIALFLYSFQRRKKRWFHKWRSLFQNKTKSWNLCESRCHTTKRTC